MAAESSVGYLEDQRSPEEVLAAVAQDMGSTATAFEVLSEEPNQSAQSPDMRTFYTTVLPSGGHKTDSDN